METTKAATKPLTANDIMTDAQVAKLVRLATYTFQVRMKHGRWKPGEFDIQAAKPIMIGRRRLWLRLDVERVIRERVLVKAR